MQARRLAALIAFGLVGFAVVVSSTAQEKGKGKKVAEKGTTIKASKVKKFTAQIKVGDARPVTRSTDQATITLYVSPGTSCEPADKGKTGSETRPPETKKCSIEGRQVDCICTTTLSLECDGNAYQTKQISTTCTATEVIDVTAGSPLDKLFE